MTINPITEKKAPMTPGSTQILFIDIQPEIVGSSRTNPPAALIRSAVAIARIGKLFDLPMHASVVPIGKASLAWFRSSRRSSPGSRQCRGRWPRSSTTSRQRLRSRRRDATTW